MRAGARSPENLVDARVYTTARYARVTARGGDLVREPRSTAHAKVVGTTTTLCGQTALSWFKLYEVLFADVSVERCERCVELAAPMTM